MSKWLFLVLLAGCSVISDFDDYRFQKRLHELDGGENEETDSATVRADSGGYDAADVSVSGNDANETGSPETDSDGDASHNTPIDGIWEITRVHEDFVCGTPPVTYRSAGTYTDSWLITDTYGAIHVLVLSSKWPIDEYRGSRNGDVLTLTGEGMGVVDNTTKTVSTDFILFIENGVITGNEESKANQCEQSRDVTGEQNP